MKKYKVPLLTEEYFATVYIGSKKDLIAPIAKHLECSKQLAEQNFSTARGITYNLYPDYNPLICVDGDLPYYEALATLAHEASHVMEYLTQHIGIEDSSGEFRAHGVAAIMRIVGKDLYPTKNKKKL